ncbi:MAG: glycosyl hydrolase 2 galactose-binding domain-containing protein, partial [Planctomycetota bacterium]
MQRDLRRIPLPRGGWTLDATGGEGAGRFAGPIEVAPHAGHASAFAALSHARIAVPVTAARAELDSEWVGRTDWCFSADVDVPAAEVGRHCALAIEWIDGTCEVLLGGVSLGTHMSEHFPFDARVPDALRGRRVRLELRFKAPVTEVLRWQERLGARPVNGDWTPFCFARSAACSFGWDWGPRVPAVGFQGARFDCWNATRILSLSVSQRWNGDGSVTVRVRPQGEFDPERVVCVVRARSDPRHFDCGADGEVTLTAAQAGTPWTTWDRRAEGHERCWWNAMAGYRDASGAFKLLATQRFAPRRIELDRTVDALGQRFRFLLNGEPVFARGANLIPPPFGGAGAWDWRAELERFRRTGFNMVRVWGGGIYLPDAFHDACDEMGILVWQDFMFACATYPEDEPFASLVAREAAHQVQRLSAHPSLALWCGGNEDILAWWSWGWKERLAAGQSWGLGYWTRTLPDAVAAHDPGTPYWTESPYSGSMELHPNDPDHGDRHTWDAEAKIEGYRTVLPRFSSEFGHQSPPCWATVVEDCIDPASAPAEPSAAWFVEAMRLRQKAWGGDEVQYRPFLEARFRPAASAREYVAQTQHLQARAMDIAMRWLRAGAPRSMGALIWQWNDVWAGHSWSLVDAAGRAKPAWHAVRRACAPRALSIEPTGGFRQGEPGALEVVLADDRAFRDPGFLARS